MKKINLFLVLISIGGLLLTSCGSSNDDEPQPNNNNETPSETVSTLKPEEHKNKLESEGVEFVQNMEEIGNLKVYSVMKDFMALNPISMFGADEEPSANMTMALFGRVENLKKGPQGSSNLKSFALNLQDEGSSSLSEMFDMLAGVYTYNESTQEFDRTESTAEITFKFKLSDNNPGEISISKFEVKAAANQLPQGMTLELPTNIQMHIKAGDVNVCTFSLTGEYWENDTPKKLTETFTLENFKAVTDFDLTTKSKLIYNYAFTHNNTTNIISNGFTLEGNIDYTAIEQQVGTAEQNGTFPKDQEIITKASAYFQIGNIKADASIAVKDMLAEVTTADIEDMATEDAVTLMNKHIAMKVLYAKENQVIAKGEFYKELKEDMSGTMEYEPSMKMVFADDSSIDDNFFETGFGDMVTEINKLITTMNTNYKANMEPLNY